MAARAAQGARYVIACPDAAQIVRHVTSSSSMTAATLPHELLRACNVHLGDLQVSRCASWTKAFRVPNLRGAAVANAARVACRGDAECFLGAARGRGRPVNTQAAQSALETSRKAEQLHRGRYCEFVKLMRPARQAHASLPRVSSPARQAADDEAFRRPFVAVVLFVVLNQRDLSELIAPSITQPCVTGPT